MSECPEQGLEIRSDVRDYQFPKVFLYSKAVSVLAHTAIAQTETETHSEVNLIPSKVMFSSIPFDHFFFVYLLVLHFLTVIFVVATPPGL